MTDHKVKAQDESSLIQALIAKYLHDNGFNNTLTTFEAETGMEANFYDNAEIDLISLVNEWRLQQKRSSDIKPASLLQRPLDLTLLPSYAFSLEDIHASNILSIKFKNLLSRTNSFSDSAIRPSYIPTVVTSAADKSIKFTNLDTGECYDVFSFHKAAVLCIDFHPHYPYLMLTGSLDGTAILFDCLERKIIQVFDDQKRFVTKVSFDPSGDYIALSSYEKCVCIYQRDKVKEKLPTDQFQYSLVHREEFQTNPETLLWLPNSVSIVVTCRDDNYIHYISPTTCLMTSYNMNQTGDDHVSFTVLDSSFYPFKNFSKDRDIVDDKLTPNYLALITSPPPAAPNAFSSAKLLLYELSSSKLVQSIYLACPMDEYTTPKHAWIQNGRGLVITGDDGILRIVEIKTGKTVKELSPLAKDKEYKEQLNKYGIHTGTIIKDVWSGIINNEEVIISVGYDKAIRVFKSPTLNNLSA